MVGIHAYMWEETEPAAGALKEIARIQIEPGSSNIRLINGRSKLGVYSFRSAIGMLMIYVFSWGNEADAMRIFWRKENSSSLVDG